ncbi:tail fiber protein [Candidatus Bathyarchaeota archaeon]|nr:tail fiber protein [Candidatus Bathyarchaeota archaeon]
MKILPGAGGVSGDAFSVGDIRDLPHDTIPDKWLECLGQSLLRADYAALFAVIGTTWGSVDGTHFTLPDFQRQTIVGRATAAGSPAMDGVGCCGGAETAALEICNLPAHTHTIAQKSVCVLACCGSNFCTGACAPFFITGGTCCAPAAACTGSGCSYGNLQPFKVCRKIIKALA